MLDPRCNSPCKARCGTRLTHRRCRQARRQQRCFARRQITRRPLEMPARCDTDAKQARTPLRDIEVNLHNSPFRPDQLNDRRNRQFQSLTGETTVSPQKEVLGDLHRDGARAPDSIDAMPVCGAHGPTPFVKVDAEMTAEAGVFGTDHGPDQVVRDLFDWRPLVPDMGTGETIT